MNSLFETVKLVQNYFKKPYYIKKAISQPRWALQALYAYLKLQKCGVSIKDFAMFLTEAGEEDIQEAISLIYDGAIYSQLYQCIEAMGRPIEGKTFGNFTLDEGLCLYVVVRIIHPNVIVETGVANGISSAFLLQALEDNGRGLLYSIDLPNEGERLSDGISYYGIDGEYKIGWVVPENLRHRWNLIFGDSSKELKPLLERLNFIDIFLHDSLHTYKHMRFEYETALPFINKGGLLLSHDVGMPYLELCRKIKAPPLRCGRIGGIRI